MIRTESQRANLMVTLYGDAAKEIPEEAGKHALKRLIKSRPGERYARAYFRKDPQSPEVDTEIDAFRSVLEHGLLSDRRARALGLVSGVDRSDPLTRDFVGLIGGKQIVRESFEYAIRSTLGRAPDVEIPSNSLFSVIVDLVEVSTRVKHSSGELAFVNGEITTGHLRAVHLGYNWGGNGMSDILRIMHDVHGSRVDQYLPILDDMGDLLWPDYVGFEEMGKFMSEVGLT
jgi:hypothetical protein